MQKTPFYVRTKHANMSFVDQETGIAVHGNKIAKVDSPVGKQTAKFIRGGGLVIVTDAEVKKAIKEDRVYEGDVFTRKTKIVMKPAVEGSLAATQGMKRPVEVPLTDEEIEQAEETPEDDEEELQSGVVDEPEDTDEEDDHNGEPSLEEVLKGKDKDKSKDKPKGNPPAFQGGVSKK